MDRRDFLRAAVAAGIGFGLDLGRGRMALPGRGFVAAGEAVGPLPDMVAVRNGEPGEMFDRGIAAMGGIGRFVGKGRKVVIKPNVSWDARPELAGNTNPELVNRVVKRCLEAGAAKVTVVDHNIENGKRCYETSRIGAAALDGGAVIAPAEAERYYAPQTVAGKALKRASIHEALLESDVFIDIPVLKHHGGGGMTGGIKNLMGLVWDRQYYHRTDLHQCIADFLAFRKPDLTVIDAYRVMLKNGPRGGSVGDVKLTRMQILSTDVVAADASAAGLLGKKPEDFRHVVAAHEMGFGQIDPTRLALLRVTI